MVHGLNCSGISPKYKFVNSSPTEINRPSGPEQDRQSDSQNGQQESSVTSQSPLRNLHDSPCNPGEASHSSTFTSPGTYLMTPAADSLLFANNQGYLGTETQNDWFDWLLRAEMPDQLSLSTTLAEDPWVELLNTDMLSQFGKLRVCLFRARNISLGLRRQCRPR